MEAVMSNKITLSVNQCVTLNELEEHGIYPKSIHAYNYSFGILYRKGNERIILQPLDEEKYKIVRMYTIFDYA